MWLVAVAGGAWMVDGFETNETLLVKLFRAVGISMGCVTFYYYSR
jgi:hypothetical protein